ncbi:prephenate dehydrogenase [Sulfurimonas sp. HSL-1716]|uniref:prephenate dehydrogenase n=1 Tax=Hydrocurvibacter sulfurireducens TaxID=3131937 RepID=UPI0031F981F5
MKVGIIGLGLMGGSLALSLKKLPFVNEIIGNDHNKEHQKQALELSLVKRIVEFEEIKRCDVIFLAVPVDGIISIINQLTDISPYATVIDFGSTKEKIVKSIPPQIRANVVAAHPMTGTEFFGPYAAVENLYKDSVVVLCDLQESGIRQKETAIRLFEGLEMKISYMHAHEHDRHTAFISHMPHAISYSLANTVIQQENREDILTLAAGGFRSMSRLAKSSPAMWEDVFKQNRENVLEAIELFEKELRIFKNHIKDQNWKELHKDMQDANTLYNIFS